MTGTGGLIGDAVAVANSPLNGGVSADTGPNGSDANIIANLTDDGSAANLVDDATGVLTSNLSESGLLGGGPIITASALPEGNGIVDNGANATVNDPAQSGPIVDLDAVSDGQNGSSQNLVNLGALDQGGSPNILANVLSDSDASNANVTGNVIDVGPEGQNLADANVLTSPDQFQFTSLDGTGADTLVGSLTDVSGATTGDTGLPVVTAPALDLTVLFNGFKPLFQALSPSDLNKLSYEVVQVFQGEGGTLEGLLAHTASVTQTLASRDEVIGQLIDNLNEVLDHIGDRDDQLTELIKTFRTFVAGLKDDRKAILGSLDQISALSAETAGLVKGIRPAFVRDVKGLRRVASNLNKGRGELDRAMQILPVKLTKIGRTAIYGSFFNFYLCQFQGNVNLPTGGRVPVKYDVGGKRCNLG